MEPSVRQEGAVTVVAFEGRLDLASLDRIKRCLTGLVDGGAWRIALDLGGVAYVDSSVLAALVAMVKRLRGEGGDLKLCSLQPAVRSVFELTQLTRLLEIHPSSEAAVAAFAARP